MKIALISFHDTLNYGAALQAYALQRYLESLGHACQYIDYASEKRSHKYDVLSQMTSALKSGKPKQAISHLLGASFTCARKRAFGEFYKNNLHITGKRYTSSAQAKELNSIYDLFIAGSDQIWNLSNTGGDGAYLLDFVEDPTKKASYASSFGMNRVPLEYEKQYTEHLNAITHLSTREQQGVDIIKGLTGRDAALVLDPVFLLNADQWGRIARHGQTGSKYLFMYTNGKDEWGKFLKTGYDLSDTKLSLLSPHASVHRSFPKAARRNKGMSPATFLGEIQNANMVVTTSFHCLAFAILFHKPFVAILSERHAGRNQRLLNLLKIAGLEHRVLRPDMKTDEIDAPIDYEAVERRLQPHRAESLEFLRKAVDARMHTKDDQRN